jgi:putative phage-type endonuclease
MIIEEFHQGSEEWWEARLGIPTASNFDKIITSKGEPSKQAKKYMYRLAGERVTGICEEGYNGKFMQRGKEMEQEAREFYEMLNDVEIKEVGLCYADASKKYSCSPDGLVGDEGLVEIKCPIITTAVEYLLAGKLPISYFEQVQGQLLVTGRKWVDFISYYPGLKPLIIRVKRDEEFITKLVRRLNDFCDELDQVTKRIAS